MDFSLELDVSLSLDFLLVPNSCWSPGFRSSPFFFEIWSSFNSPLALSLGLSVSSCLSLPTLSPSGSALAGGVVGAGVLVLVVEVLDCGGLLRGGGLVSGTSSASGSMGSSLGDMGVPLSSDFGA